MDWAIMGDIFDTRKRDEKIRQKLFGNRYSSFKCRKCGMMNGSRILGKCLYCGAKV